MPPRPDRRVFWLLERASAGVRQRIERLAGDHLDTTAAQLPVLFFLAGKEAARPSELAEALGVNAAAITGITGRMEAAGVLRRKPSPEDGRAQQLSLTAAGRRIAESALPRVASLQAELLEGFTADEIETVMRFLRGVVERAPTLGEPRPSHDQAAPQEAGEAVPRSAPVRAGKTRRRSPT
jgi:MarR family transcriptional regulator, organic hydroperoxide resistance regulator